MAKYARNRNKKETFKSKAVFFCLGLKRFIHHFSKPNFRLKSHKLTCALPVKYFISSDCSSLGKRIVFILTYHSKRQENSVEASLNCRLSRLKKRSKKAKADEDVRDHRRTLLKH